MPFDLKAIQGGITSVQLREKNKDLFEFQQLANSVVINLGTLDEKFIALCEYVCGIANQLKKPIILDPVGAGASHYRTNTSLHLINNYDIAIIRGNASEIMSLSDASIKAKGVDSTIGGAGIQADIKTISAASCYAASVITALTAQNTLGVQAIYEIAPEFVKQQLESVFNDLNIKAVKIGMLHNEKIISVVSSALQSFKPSLVVLDPVMMSKNGCQLIDPCTIPILEKMIFPHITLITPNLMEAKLLLGIKITNASEQASAAIKMGAELKINVLIKGGHFDGQQSSDILYLYNDALCHWFHAKRIYSQNTHGTGCSLSSAIASYLAKGYSLKDAIDHAKKYLTQAIDSGTRLQIGRGCGPVDHFYFLENEYDF